MPRSRLARLLAVLALLAVPPVTCAVAPALHSLMARTERLEALVASLPAVVVDANGYTLGPVLGLDHYSERYTFASAQVRATTVQMALDGLPPFLAEVRRDAYWVPLNNGLQLNFESEDCTGEAWVIDWGYSSLWPPAFLASSYHSETRTLYMADLEQSSQRVDVRSYYRVSRFLPSNQLDYDERDEWYYDQPCTLVSSRPPYHDVWNTRAWPMLPVADLRDYFEPPYRLVAGEEFLDQ